MLYVLLILLKIIGILLALAVGLIILILAMPIRYSFRFNIDEDTFPGGQVKVTWLLAILYIKASYIDKVFDYRVRIFGYQILGNQKEFLEKKQKKKDRDKRKKKRQEDKRQKDKKKQKEEKQKITADKQENSPSDKQNQTSEPEELRKVSLPEKTDTEEKEQQPVQSDVRKTEDNAEKKAKPRKDSDVSRKKKKTQKESRLISLKKKIEKLKAVWKEYNGKQLMDFAKTIIIKIARHILPRKLRGYIRFGFDDPAATGVVTGAAALFYPKYQNSFTLEPDFQQQCFAADCQGKGRIHLGFFLYTGITALMNLEVRNRIRMML